MVLEERPRLHRQAASRDLNVMQVNVASTMRSSEAMTSMPSTSTNTTGPFKRLVPHGNPDESFEVSDDFIVVEHEHHAPNNETDAGRRLRSRNLQQSTSQVSQPRGSGEYKITYQYVSDATTQMKASFEYAASRLGKMITTKHTPIRLNPAQRCRGLALPSQVEDLFIYIKIGPIDGTDKRDNVLGQAGPCILDGNGYPRVGYVEFDVADVSKMISEKTFDAVCVHEILHIIGFGTLWDSLELIGGTSSDPRYMGRYGTEALPAVNGTFMGTPAVQDTGGEGTALSHWRDTVFGDEMMTAYLSASYQPLSSLTVESLRDIGYTVDGSAADSFKVSPSGYLPNVAPTWYSPSSGFWTTTTIWIIAFAGGAALVIIFSCIYVRCRKRKAAVPPPRPAARPTPMSSSRPSAPPPPAPPVAQPVVGLPRTAYGNIPVAQPVTGHPSLYAVPEHDLGMFMEITGCRDRAQATKFMREANNNVSLAVDRYLHVNARTLAVV